MDPGVLAKRAALAAVAVFIHTLLIAVAIAAVLAQKNGSIFCSQTPTLFYLTGCLTGFFFRPLCIHSVVWRYGRSRCFSYPQR
jgi:hypothetical protein